MLLSPPIFRVNKQPRWLNCLMNLNRIAGRSNSFVTALTIHLIQLQSSVEPLWIGLAHLQDSMTSLLSVGHVQSCCNSMSSEIAAILKRQVHPGKAIDFSSLGSSGQQPMSNVLKMNSLPSSQIVRRTIVVGSKEQRWGVEEVQLSKVDTSLSGSCQWPGSQWRLPISIPSLHHPQRDVERI